MPKTPCPLNQLIYQRINKAKQHLSAKMWTTSKDIPVSMGPLHKDFIKVSQAKRETFKPVKINTYFAPRKDPKNEHSPFPWTQRWFKVSIPAPKAGEKGKRYLHFICHGEITAYLDGEPWGAIDCCHPRMIVPDKACTLYLDCGVYQTGIWGGLQPPDDRGFQLMKSSLQVKNESVWDTFWDLAILIEWLDHEYKKIGMNPGGDFGLKEPLHKINPNFRRMLTQLNNAIDVYENDGLKAFAAELKTIYKKFPVDKTAMTTSFVGHAHIDLVWLWPERVTYRKGIHTYANVLQLMKKYPEFIFTMSQPALLHKMKEMEPKQASQIIKRIKEGRWEATGGFEVESDTLVAAGEGLARALIYGQERFEELRGEKTDTVWIPDVFGYNQYLPQIFSLGGIKNFYTQKILWSAVNKFPHNSFTWKSPDGSSVLTHLALQGYNSECRVWESEESVMDYQQSDVHDEVLLAAGYGDGGGGPTEDHCERLERMQNLAGIPKSQWSNVEDFFKRMTKVQDDLPVYRGELYLEYHRGTLTTQSDFTAAFRACERALQTQEAIRAIKGMKALPKEAWLRYIFAQFHDAIPGSSIIDVYREFTPELQGIAADTLAAATKDWGASKSTTATTVVNPLAITRSSIVDLPAPSAASKANLVDDTGRAIPYQLVGRGKAKKAIASVSLMGLESRKLSYATGKAATPGISITASSKRLSNGIVDANFDAKGQLIGLTIEGMPMQIEGPAGLNLHVDYPANFDAWDIDHQATWNYEAVARNLKLKVVEKGNVRAVLEGRAKIGEKSDLVLRYILEANSSFLKIQTDVDWHEDHKLLRYSIPTSYRGQMARFGSPYGSTDRVQTEGMPVNEAQWEVPGSRWMAITDGTGEGLAIVTEAKYGFSAKDGQAGVSLLRAPKHPDPTADMGKHSIQFAIGAHQLLTIGEDHSTTASADALYTPIVALPGGSTKDVPFQLDNLGTVVPAWVLPARESKGTVIRLHETAGTENEIIVRFNKAPKKVELVDLLENKMGKAHKLDATTYLVPVAAYKIVSVKYS